MKPRVVAIVIGLLVLISGNVLAEEAAESQKPDAAPACEGASLGISEEDLKDPAKVLEHFGLLVDEARPVGTWLLQCPTVTECLGECYSVPGCSTLIDTGAAGCEQTACPQGKTIHILQCNCDHPEIACPYRLDWACK